MTLHSFNKKALILAMLAATGLAAPLASAQFKIEHSAKNESKQKTKVVDFIVKDAKHGEEQVVMVVKCDDDGVNCELKIVNGEIVFAELDGKEYDSDHIKMKDHIAFFINNEGEAIHEIEVPKIPNAKGFWITADGENIKLDGEVNFAFMADGAPDDDHFIVKGEVYQPKVMLGINLSEPSDILRKHLQLKDGMQAILVEKVIDGLPAQLGGLEDFDVIVSIDGSKDASSELLGKILSEKEAGDSMKIIVLRAGDKIKLKVKLAEYNAQALGAIEVTTDFVDTEATQNDIEFQIHTILKDGGFGELQEIQIEKIKKLIQDRIGKIGDQHTIAIELRGKAMKAMMDGVQQRVFELRDGELRVRNIREFEEQMKHLKGGLVELHEQMPTLNPDTLHHLETRLAGLEERLDRQLDQMGAQMDRLAMMFERLMNAIENDED